MKKLLLICLITTHFTASAGAAVIQCDTQRYNALVEKARHSAKTNPAVAEIEYLTPYTHKENLKIAAETFVTTFAFTTLSFLGLGSLLTNASTAKLFGWGAGIGTLLGYLFADFSYHGPLFTKRMHARFKIKTQDAINDPATGTWCTAEHEYYHGTVYKHLRK